MNATRSLSVLAAMAVFAAASHPAHAAEQDDSRKVVVDYGDLNLSRNTGVKVLYRRLRTAATTVCASLDGRKLAQRAIWQQCYSQALSAAVVEVNEPALSALHSHSQRERALGDSGTLVSAR
jgi:UrcA family protein